jgi:outer membrane receptor protein involved in Fe transport
MTRRRNRFHQHALAAAVVLALAGAAQAQLSTATVKGQVAQAQGGTAVVAVNKDNGSTYRTTTLADGSYVLTGLAPGPYEIRVGDQKSEVITLQVGETATVDLAPAGAQQITIVGTAVRKDVKNSEVGTVVSRKLIETLPQATHNFLSAADLAPGVAFITEGNGFTRIQSGGQNNDNINVFIDGVGQKNNILRRGITGQDVSRGNPFPQSAIQEYRVLTQNYKAEFEQVSSAAITAITRSGTNDLHVDAYVDRTGTNWRAKTPFEARDEANGVKLPSSSKNEFGLAVGGPIKQDQTHYFLAYDGKDIDDSRQFVPQNLNLLPNAGLVPTLAAKAGGQVQNFREHLLFGKVDTDLTEDQRLSLSLRVRRENDLVAEDRRLSAPGNDKDRVNDETRVDLKHEWNRGAWLAESRAGYEDAVYNPKSADTSPFFKYKVSTAAPQLLSASQDVAFDGGSPDAQRRQQKGFYFSEDLTYTGLKGHVLKGGVKVKSMKYNLTGTSRSVDIVETLLDTASGNPFYDSATGLCTGTNLSSDGLQSDQCRISAALPSAGAKFDNTQVGLYVQDDWALAKQLELNLGVRWDYETNMLNNDYRTPQDRIDALFAADGRTIAGITAPPGQTYAQSLALGGIDINEYIANGKKRKAYKGAFAPRVGASYDVFGDRNTVVFGGYGRSYDRTMANHALDELQKNAQAGGEIWMIKNDFKMPYADQFTLGVRQGFGDWNTEAALGRVHAKNQFIWFHGNRDPNGGFGTQSPIDPLWGGPNGFGSLILGDFAGENRTDSLYLKFEKPYTRSSGWTATIAYTYSDAKTRHRDWNDDIFDWTYRKPGVRGWNRSILVDKHRLVAAGVVDNLLPWGMTLSGKLTWASGKPRRITSCADGFSNCVNVEGDSPSFRQIDMSVTKELAFGEHKFALRADVLNVFNVTNYGGFDDWGGGPVAPGNPANDVGGDNLNLGKPNAIRGDPRTFRLAISYKF